MMLPAVDAGANVHGHSVSHGVTDGEGKGRGLILRLFKPVSRGQAREG
jgi:hypothetical protein